MYGRLLAGAEGYDVVLQHQTRIPFAILALEPRFRHPDGSFTTLHKVNPLVTVLRRRDVRIAILVSVNEKAPDLLRLLALL